MYYLLIPIVLYLLYKLSMRPYSYWEKKGVPTKKPYPLVGNFGPILLQTKSFFDAMKDITEGFENERYFGNYQFYKRCLIILDHELAKQILVKDFDHFTDHNSGGIDEDIEPILNKNLLMLKGERWRDMRSVMSPAFTGTKMRAMFHLMVECAKNVPKYLDKLDDEEIDTKDFFTRYTNDVIATCAFGVTCDSLEDKENEFYVMSKEATNLQGWRAVRMLIMNFAPTLFKLFKLKVFSETAEEFYYNLIKETIAYRSQHEIIRPDMLHLLIEAKKGKLKHEEEHEKQDSSFAVVEESSVGKRDVKCDLTDTDIVAQAFIFFFAGFETTSTMLSFFAIELSHNHDVQNKLRAEIDVMMDANGDNPSYDDIIGMKYMDMCVSETLRKWPSVPFIDRTCTKDYFIPAKRPQEKDLHIDTTVIVGIPALALQRDPRYFPDPEKFDPERFSEENKHKILPFTYLPFGFGPRACIGSRFALLEIKVIMAFILRNFELHKSPKVSMPIELKRRGFKNEPVNGFLLKIRPRKRQI